MMLNSCYCDTVEDVWTETNSDSEIEEIGRYDNATKTPVTCDVTRRVQIDQPKAVRVIS